MKVYFLRHGIAEDHAASGSDRDRRLTEEGVAEMEKEAKGLKRLAPKLDLLLTSPYPRARRTAEIVADALGLSDRLHVDERLAPGFRLGDLQEIVEEHPHVLRLMLVGHNPDLPDIAGHLSGEANLDLKKGGLIRVDADMIEPGSGTLEWLLPPDILKVD